ncbi:phage tail tape measure protein [Pseudomonas sp. NEEL19]|uniref:phage tail tape measure protein n=1 Tax=Pseudomonas sp. NEEL19 TaxID=2867409 RepID=UPI002367C003|nr:phage tail tape measure protein [Pseudomonas sp. NEEL19]WDM60658.1 phage tail tape measure protein [Pseudomonas sp. NEEL19]
MSEPDHSSMVTLAEVKVTPEQMAMIQQNQEAFLSIFKQMLAEHAKTNELLACFLQALAEDQGAEPDPDQAPQTYLSGDWLDGLNKRFKIPQEAMPSMREAAGGYSSLADNAKKAGERVSAYTKELNSARETTNAAGDADAKATSAGQTYLDTLDKQLATLKDKTAVEAAERFITDNKIKTESDLAKQIRERAKAVDAQKEADKAATQETKDGTKAASQLAQMLDKAAKSHLQLKKTYDPVGAAADEFKLQVQDLDLLLSKNKITTEEYGLGIAALADQFNSAVQASTGLSQAMKYQADLERQLAIARQQGDAAAAAIGMGDKQSSRAQSRLALEQENNNKILALRDELAAASTEKQRQELEKQIALRQEYGAKLVQAQEDSFAKIDAAQADWSNGASAALENYLDSAADVAGQTQELFSNAFSNLEDGVTQFVKTGKFEFKDFADSIIEDLIRIQIRQAAAGFLGTAFSFLGGGGSALGQGIMTGFSEVIPNAKGGVYDSPSLSSFSNHVHDSPQMFAFAKGAGIFAEAGPEAILPLHRGPDGSLGVMAAGAGGGGNESPFSFGGITQNFHFHGGAGASKEDLEKAAFKGANGGYELILRDFKTNGAAAKCCPGDRRDDENYRSGSRRNDRADSRGSVAFCVWWSRPRNLGKDLHRARQPAGRGDGKDSGRADGGGGLRRCGGQQARVVHRPHAGANLEAASLENGRSGQVCLRLATCHKR